MAWPGEGVKGHRTGAGLKVKVSEHGQRFKERSTKLAEHSVSPDLTHTSDDAQQPHRSPMQQLRREKLRAGSV
jgi:hypothetical protein